jgi:NIPSNAP
MHTLCIRYTLDLNRLGDFRLYVTDELEAIRAAGGRVVGYWLPTDFAGPTNIGYGLIEFSSLDHYEKYRHALAADPLHQRNARRLIDSGAIVNMERSIIARCGDDHEV